MVKRDLMLKKIMSHVQWFSLYNNIGDNNTIRVTTYVMYIGTTEQRSIKNR